MTAIDWERVRVDPTDPRFHLLCNLRDVQTGRKPHAPGIRRCPDCAEPWINDHTGLATCPSCRTSHRRRCTGCHALMTNTTDGRRLCNSCTDQIALF